MDSIQNHVQLIGRTGKDLEMKTTASSNRTYVNFSIVTTERYRDANGDRQERAQWHNMVAWGKTAESLTEYTKKGQRLAIKGKLQSRTYETQDNQKRTVTEVLVKEFMLLS